MDQPIIRHQRPKIASPVRRAFSLIELIVVIGMALLLASLIITVTVGVVERVERSETRTTLRLLDAAVREWQVSTDRTLTWGINDQPTGANYDVDPTTDELFVITEVLDRIRHFGPSASILSAIAPDALYQFEAGVYPPWVTSAEQRHAIDTRFDGSLMVLDAWGTPIYATHPGRLWHPGDDPDDRDADGTIRTPREMIYGVCRNRRVCFVAAGPDLRFGSYVHYAEGWDESSSEHRHDNVYSYDPLPPPDDRWYTSDGNSAPGW